MEHTDPATVIEFWFGPLTGGFAAEERRRRWFAGDRALDEEIRSRFAAACDAAAAGSLDWGDTPEALLALILVSDQFPRHLHRGSALAYATDPLALTTARRGIEQGLDRRLALEQRAFFYMPFQHAESRLAQHTSVGLFTALRDETPPGRRQLTGEFLRHAQQHRDIVLRFGRFPHRNGILGRESTEEELAFLETASDYGQRPPGPAAPDPA